MTMTQRKACLSYLIRNDLWTGRVGSLIDRGDSAPKDSIKESTFRVTESACQNLAEAAFNVVKRDQSIMPQCCDAAWLAYRLKVFNTSRSASLAILKLLNFVYG